MSRISSSLMNSGVDVILLRIGTSFIREEALKRVHMNLDLLEQASNQGPGAYNTCPADKGIRKGIGIIKSQLARATRGEFTTPPQPMLFDPDQVPPGLGSNRTIVDTNPSQYAFPMGNLDTSFNMPTNGAEPDAGLISAQQLLSLLGQTPVSTDDPFAFMSGATWGNWTG